MLHKTLEYIDFRQRRDEKQNEIQEKIGIIFCV